jgi:hypothetical protein
MQDPGFIAEMKASYSDIRYLSGGAVLKHVTEIYATPQSVRELAIHATHEQ